MFFCSVPVNCAFEIDDLEKEWTWSRPFDYIFSRMMVGSFADFSGFISQAYQYVSSCLYILTFYTSPILLPTYTLLSTRYIISNTISLV